MSKQSISATLYKWVLVALSLPPHPIQGDDIGIAQPIFPNKLRVYAKVKILTEM
jgi:hypothetical protein